MKFSWRLLLLGSLAVVAPTFAADVHQASVSKSVGRVLQLTEAQFLSVAEAMPANLYGFAPSGTGFVGVRTFAEQVKHVACSNIAFFKEIEHKAPPEHCEKGDPSKAQRVRRAPPYQAGAGSRRTPFCASSLEASTKEELLKYLRGYFDYGNTVLAAMTDVRAQAKVQGQYWGNNTSLTVAVAAVWHIADHYGQLVPYLRLNNVVPPQPNSIQ